MPPRASGSISMLIAVGAGLTLFPLGSAQQLPGEQAILLDYSSQTSKLGNGVDDLDSFDLDGDGDDDVVSANSNSGLIRFLVNDGAGSFTSRSLSVSGRPTALAPVDVDADGDIDLVVGADRELRVLLNDGLGNFAVGPAISFAGGDQGSVGIAVADVDHDGRWDVVVGISDHSLGGGGYTGGALIGFGDGAGGFVLSATHALPLPAHRTVVADFDGDGQPDIGVLGGYVTASKVDVAFGAPDGSFTNSGTQYSAGLYASGFEQADFDGDGDIDFATGNKYSLPIFWNDGTGHFVLGPTLSPGYYTKGIAAGDLDDDGDQDLLATSGSSNAIRLYTNDGTGSFALTKSLPATVQTLSVMLADTSGDGYLDPWAGDYSTGEIAYGVSQALVARYGAAKQNSLGCLPALTATGTPTANGAGLTVAASELLIDQPALWMVSATPANIPAFGGELLVLPPWVLLATRTSHGSGDSTICDGTLTLFVDGSTLSALGVGTRLYFQVLSSDPGLPAPPRVSLSDGLWFEVN